MDLRATPHRAIAAAAALARIEEMQRRTAMAAHEISTDNPVRAMWALGDYHAFAKALIWEVGPQLVSACGVSPGQRLLDVAAGTGNVAIRAAKAGAEVVASDLTPENFEAGRREAAAQGVEIDWVEGDAQALPFADDEFDVVTSCFGALFAPDHRAVARELVRVCRPGGTIGMANFAPGGTAGAFFDLVGRYAPPPPPGAQPPVLWGTEEHLHELFGDAVESLEATRRSYVEQAAGPEAYRDLFYRTFGPVIAVRASLEDDPERAAEFDREFLEFATRENESPAGDPAEYTYEYLLVVARVR